MTARVPIQVGQATYLLSVDRRILGGQRAVHVVAYRPDGTAVLVREITTTSAKAYLTRDTDQEPPTWEELEAVATDLIVIELEDEADAGR